ncbi:MAG TPA: ABC transporter permease subunit, partial [Gemmatales bacterium]|nr:ABC transporter permease subunit [Gemmatales bacterium]
GVFLGAVQVGRTWVGEHRAAVEIDLSPWRLPEYTFFSLSRGLIAYVLSLGFTLAYGWWAAKDKIAARVLLPLLDILQSIPVLGFMPGLMVAFVALFPGSNVGLELVAIIMIFTGQVWNMTFSFYHSLRSIPTEMKEVARVYGFTTWQRFKWLELPFSMIGLVWNSMMSMAGGWFFLMINEAFQLGDRDFRLPGVGSYMSVAVERGDVPAMVYAVIAMTIMILALDQLLWRPIVVWAQKFRVEEGADVEEPQSWFLTWLRRAWFVEVVGGWIGRWLPRRSERPAKVQHAAPRRWPLAAWLRPIPLVLLVGVLLWGAVGLFDLLKDVTWSMWLDLGLSTLVTMARVLLAVAIGTLWAVPAGLAIGLSPKWSQRLQPVVQIVASFPAPMLFPVVLALLDVLNVSLSWGAIALMLLGTQWYLLFNVMVGAMAIPADLKEMATSYRIRGWQRFTTLYFPAVFPYLVTGWVTAAGGAWNASIVAEFVTFRSETLQTYGIGARITEAAEAGNFSHLAAGVIAMSLVVVLFNRMVWQPCYRLAERKYSLNK